MTQSISSFLSWLHNRNTSYTCIKNNFERLQLLRSPQTDVDSNFFFSHCFGKVSKILEVKIYWCFFQNIFSSHYRMSKNSVRSSTSYMWRSIGKGVLNKTIDVKVQAQKCLNFDVNRFVKYSFSYGTSHIYCSKMITLDKFFSPI